MNFDLPGERRLPPWVIAVLVGAILWFLFDRSTVPSPIVSDWQGDGVPLQNAVAGATQPQGLTALFEQQQQSKNTGLAADPHPQDIPWGNPTDSTAVVMTQGYGIGTHAPAAVWGGIDLAVDGNGDGEADPQGSMGAPLYATMSGVIETKANSVPAGNHLWIKNDHYKVGYGHLKEFAVQDGQTVKRGDLIGYMGATGQASGPHLHYHIWQDGVNINPLEFGVGP